MNFQKCKKIMQKKNIIIDYTNNTLPYNHMMIQIQQLKCMQIVNKFLKEKKYKNSQMDIDHIEDMDS